MFDSWYARLANLKAIRGHGWRWVTRLKANRTVNPAGSGARPRGVRAISETGTRVHPHGSGFVRLSLAHPPSTLSATMEATA